MPKPKQALDALKAAKEAYKAKFTPGFYHSSANPNIKEFDPNAKPNEWIASSQTKPRGAIFVGRNPTFTESLIGKEVTPTNKVQDFKTGATTYPVSVNLGKHFDYATPEGLTVIEEYKKLNPKAKLSEFLERGSWDAIEQPEFLDFLKNKGFDTFATQEVGFKNVGVFNPKNIRGKFAEYNPEHAESADFMKAEGGKINPIKTPREMLFDLVEIPRMAAGKMPPQVQEMVSAAIKKYIQTYKKAPPAEDIKALRAHAASLSQKPTIWHDPVTQARARHQLATDPNLINPDTARDQFLTQAMTGRTVKGTYLEPKPMDINDPNVVKAIEAEQAAGMLDVPPTTTPGASALAETATALENRELSQGATPLIDKLKAKFFKDNKRFPTEEELDALVAGYNPLRHQYGPVGENILTSRPPTAKGLSQWKEKARMEGIPESYLEKSPADYRKPQRDVLSIGRGEQPTTPVTPEDAIKNPNREYADGRSVAALTPREMEAMMVAYGQTPKRLRGYEQSWKNVKDFFQGMRDAPTEIVAEYAKMLGPQKAEFSYPEERTIGAPQGRFIPQQGSSSYETGKFLSGMVGDPSNILYGVPFLNAIKKTAKIPLKAISKNPIKSATIAGALPSASIGSDNEEEPKFYSERGSVMEGYQ